MKKSKNIYLTRSQLVKDGVVLRNMAMDKSTKIEKAFEIREQQEEQYKKWAFYDGFIKAKDKLKKEGEKDVQDQKENEVC